MNNQTDLEKSQSAKILACYGITPNDLQKGGEGSRGGKVTGHTKSGKAIYGVEGKQNTMRTLLYKLNLESQVNKFSANHKGTEKDWGYLGELIEVVRSLDTIKKDDDLMYNEYLQNEVQILTDVLHKRDSLNLIPAISKRIMFYFGKK